jgi:hypothetical protein
VTEAQTQRNSTDVLPSSPLDLHWRVHLLRRDPQRLPVVVMIVGIGAGCVWLMFGALLPVLAASLLLIGSAGEYLLPITYRLTPTEAGQESAGTHMALAWKDTRRCRLSKNAILITSLPAPSRLDAFRGILLRFAEAGQPGDRASVLAALAHYAPHLLEGKAEE